MCFMLLYQNHFMSISDQINRDVLRQQLAEPYALPRLAIDSFHKNGYVKLKQVLSPKVIDFYGAATSNMVQQLNKQTKPLAERNTYERAFLQISNIWEQDETVREFAFSARLARIAAELMGVNGVRIYHDQALYKEPGGGFTPWHADQFYWPLSNSNTCTAWIPLQDTPLELGPLSFSVGSHVFEKGRDLGISDDSERQISFNLKDFPIDDCVIGVKAIDRQGNESLVSAYVVLPRQTLLDPPVAPDRQEQPE